MAKENKPLKRRDVLKKCGITLGIGTALAGCTSNNQSTGGGSSGNQSTGGGSSGNQSTGGGSSGNQSSSASSLTITLATAQPPENVGVKAVSEFFSNKLKQKSNGRITVDLKAASLGGTEDILNALEAGTVDIVLESPIALAQRYSSKYTFAGDPFVIEDMNHYKKVQKEYLIPKDGLNGILLENGLRLSDSYRVGFRGTTANSAVKNPNDVQGLKIRLPKYETWNTIWSEMGANPTPVAYDELYSALQTGVAEASEGPISQFMAKSLYNVQSHFSDTNHVLSVDHFIFNDRFYQNMGEKNRKLVTSTVKEATPKISKRIKRRNEKLYKKAKNKGTTIVQEENVNRQSLVNAAMPALRKLSKNQWAANINKIQNLA
jgi:tripartite ATP-independent transporter DctP family solute receptor